MTPKEMVDQAVIMLGTQSILPSSARLDKVVYDTLEKPGGPWIYSRYSRKNCVMLRTFIYGLISLKLPKDDRFIPAGCQDCWKVVVRPETLKELYELRALQADLDYPSKCGIEKRKEVDALYGGYWYCASQEEGLERLAQVRDSLKDTRMQAFLKRGCTEYETAFGYSDRWKITELQKAIEEEVYARIAIDNPKMPQTAKEQNDIMQIWEDFADVVGDNYSGSHSYVTYEPA